ncbi:hypothetical protein WH47_08743 [Habropoda laboriosa]|uniref:Uncharacterized protein n=1 Tax=Habropoda laboriosa TaxID=597456 RepID=A0A0L7QP10_9HYME|nr:hypothetical protein WH47_08743 [Habropoda laboriosa]
MILYDGTWKLQSELKFSEGVGFNSMIWSSRDHVNECLANRSNFVVEINERN